jgi:MraZ protein
VEGLLPLLHLGSVFGLEPALAFRGTSEHTLDAKNRLTVPARYRGTLGESVVLGMTVDQLPCVGAWRPADYEAYTERALADLPPLSPRRTELQRFFFGGSHDVDIDAAGRIMLPAFLMRHAGLRKEVVIVGAGDRLEVWDRDGWSNHQPTLLGGVAEITAQVGHPA